MEQKDCDPGWNDPPMLSYSASNPPPKSRITNKRIAFPLFNDPPITTSQPMNLGASSTVPQLHSESGSCTETSIESKCDSYFKTDKAREIFLAECNDSNQPKDYQEIVKLLAQHLKESNTTDALKLRNKLKTEYGNLCNEWINLLQL